jgi:nucleoside-diphosphate-sugar epimerase
MKMETRNVLVTGAAGFVGTALRARLAATGRSVRATSRSGREGCIGAGTITAATDWSRLLAGIDSVVHLAARVHVMNDTALDALAEYRASNVDATVNLAQQAAQAGVQRFVFLSSIKVNGEVTQPGGPFTAASQPAPVDPYGMSKLEAEQALLDLAQRCAMTVTIIRPPLVYGPGVRANFQKMMSWLYREIPLPFGAVHNKRTLISLANLVDLIDCCLSHPRAANQVLLAGDAESLSTPELLRRTAAALGKRAILLPVPTWALQCGAALSGRRAWLERLCSSLEIDSRRTQELLGWRPTVSVDEALRSTAEDFLRARAGALSHVA